MRYTHTEKPNIALRLAALLLCLTLFSLYLLSGLYARYTVTGTAADSARVAAFQPTATITPVTETIKYVYRNKPPASAYTVSYNIKVTNPSEVAVNCELVITLDAKLAQYYEGSNVFSIPDSSVEGGLHYLVTDPSDPTGRTLETISLGTLDAHDTMGFTCELTYHFTQHQFDRLIEDASWEGDLDLTQYFTASVTFTQVD